MRTFDWQTVLLDLLNTTPVVDGVATDVLARDAPARVWLRAHEARRRGRRGHPRTYGTTCRSVVRGEAARRGPQPLPRTGVRQVPERHGRRAGLGRSGSRRTGARVVLAWGELQNDRPGRLRPCANGECHLFLLDRSRGGTGRWCSMSGCGNRMKARRHYRPDRARRLKPRCQRSQAWNVAGMRHYYSADAIRAGRSPAAGSLPDGALMRRAAFGLASAIASELRAATGGIAGRRVCAVVGSGDNGGDALWAATFLRRRGVGRRRCCSTPTAPIARRWRAFTAPVAGSSKACRPQPIW